VSTTEDIKDAIRELEIALAGKHVELSQALMSEPGSAYFQHASDRDCWKERMQQGVKERSAAQVERMEAQRGLAHA